MGIRMREQECSARAGQFEARFLRYPTGEVPREACLQVTVPLLAALWKEIRDFQPDYIFCPPYTSDPRAGIHVDHVAVAEAVRKVAYMINVPHAFTPEYPADETASKACKVPVIVTVYDGYMAGENSFDLAIDVEEAFDTMCEESWCHQSQVVEWLPWVGRHSMPVPRSMEDWRVVLRDRFSRRNRELGLNSDRIHEVFTITAWGEVPAKEQVIQDFHGFNANLSNLEALWKRLRRWSGQGN